MKKNKEVKVRSWRETRVGWAVVLSFFLLFLPKQRPWVEGFNFFFFFSNEKKGVASSSSASRVCGGENKEEEEERAPRPADYGLFGVAGCHRD